MESAATPTKPKRVRVAKAGVASDEMGNVLFPAPKKRIRTPKAATTLLSAALATHRERMAAVDARAAETRKRVEAEYAEKGYGPTPRTSFRWIGRRTKGLPFSRMVIERTIPGMQGMPGVIVAKHPTRKRELKFLSATPAILQTFMPSLPPGLAAAMLGTN